MSDNETEIERAANNMIERYGDSALKEVDLRILELESRNQEDALQLWLDVRKRLELLLTKPDGRAKH
ncbi:MAG: hypothetical protein OEU50_16375 [Gammaproteobacteria bacterium]|nr:hypothetical protein [Gammaproteobacteria bacterium]